MLSLFTDRRNEAHYIRTQPRYSCVHWFSQPRSQTLSFHPIKMASPISYFVDCLEDFVLLAYDSPLWATLLVLLLASLAFSNTWASWITHIQQCASLNVTGIFNTRRGANNDVASPPYPANQPSRDDIGYNSTRQNLGRADFVSGANTVLNRPQRVQHGPIGLQRSPPHPVNGFNPSGNNLISQPHRNRGGVSFYPSTSPGYRGQSVLPQFRLLAGA